MANLPIPAPLSEIDYEQIEGAVMETARGRWFLDEYARRNRDADTNLVLAAIERIETVVRDSRDREAYQSVRGDLLKKLGRFGEARAEFERAATLTRNTRERELLLARSRACTDGSRPSAAQ